MSTPSLNAEKWLFPTVLQYCRQTRQHLNPPRGMSYSIFTGLFLYCLVLFSVLYFPHIRLSNHWCRPCAIGSIICLVMLLLECIFLGEITSWLLSCPVRVPRTMCLCLRPSWWAVYLAQYVFLVDFLHFGFELSGVSWYRNRVCPSY